MDNTKPLVSIIVRTKDRPKLLLRALQSIAAQTYRPLEVLLVNDGGCSLEIDALTRLLGDVSLRYLPLEKNRGRAGAGNAGIEASRGTYVGFLDDDDELYPDHVETLARVLQNGKVQIAYTDSLMAYDQYDPQTQEITSQRTELVYSHNFDYDILVFENYIPFICLMFSSEILKESGGFDSDFELYEDYDLLIRLGKKYEFLHISKTTALYHQWSSTSQISQDNRDEQFVKTAYLRLFKKHIDKFTPQRIYNYRAIKYMSLQKSDASIRSLGEHLDYKEKLLSEKEKLLSEKEIHLSNLREVIKGKDQYISSISDQLQQRDYHVQQKDKLISQVESLLREKEETLNGIYSSTGWKMLTVLYRIRDILFPPKSFRKRLAKGIIKAILLPLRFVLKKKNKGIAGRLFCHIETDFSGPFVVGPGNALCLRGWCYHTSEIIKGLSVFVEQVEYRVSNHSFFREDIFKDQFQKVDFSGNSLNCGFWVIIPFRKIALEQTANLRLRAELCNGEICTTEIGTLNLKPTAVSKDPDTGKRLQEKRLVAICMATFNPSIEHFKRQVQSIIQQTYTDWICIVSDDASDPELFEKMRETISSDSRFKMHRNVSNLGFYYNFEKCLSYVPECASFVMLSDQDDYWHEDKLSGLLSHFDDETLLVYSDMNIVNEKGEIIYDTYWTTRKNNFRRLDLLMLANTITGAASIFRTGLLKLLLPFPERVGDLYHDHFIACVALGEGKIQYVDSALYDYYQHSSNVLGHFVKEEKRGEKNFINLSRKISSNISFSKWLDNLRVFSMHYRAVYYNHYPRRALIANVLALRCENATAEKRKIIERFVHIEKSYLGLIYLTLKNKLLGADIITLGIDSVLVKSVLVMKLTNAYWRVRRSFL